MRIAVIGQSGQLARALHTRTAARSLYAQFYGRDALDLTADAATITTFIDGLNVDAVVIAAAYTAVDKAEDDRDIAFAVNAAAPTVIAKACAARGFALVHISTDYVFDGKGTDGPYAIHAPTAPINVYGASKYAGEQGVQDSGAKAAVLRTSWVFDGTGANFMTTMLRLGQTRDALSVVHDQIGRPTFAAHLADAVLEILPAVQAGKASGLYHVTGTGAPISWADFARAIFDISADHRNHDITVTDIASKDYPTAAARPAYSVLDTSRFSREIAPLPDWQSGLKQAYKDWAASQ